MNTQNKFKELFTQVEANKITNPVIIRKMMNEIIINSDVNVFEDADYKEIKEEIAKSKNANTKKMLR